MEKITAEEKTDEMGKKIFLVAKNEIAFVIKFLNTKYKSMQFQNYCIFSCYHGKKTLIKGKFFFAIRFFFCDF